MAEKQKYYEIPDRMWTGGPVRENPILEVSERHHSREERSGWGVVFLGVTVLYLLWLVFHHGWNYLM